MLSSSFICVASANDKTGARIGRKALFVGTEPQVTRFLFKAFSEEEDEEVGASDTAEDPVENTAKADAEEPMAGDTEAETEDDAEEEVDTNGSGDEHDREWEEGNVRLVGHNFFGLVSALPECPTNLFVLHRGLGYKIRCSSKCDG